MTQSTTISSHPPAGASSSAKYHPSDIYPSPPAHPNDLRLLQSPLWQCSPLPPEHSPNPALPSETKTEEESKISRNAKKLFSKRRA
jgi:hypothetical protein